MRKLTASVAYPELTRVELVRPLDGVRAAVSVRGVLNRQLISKHKKRQLDIPPGTNALMSAEVQLTQRQLTTSQYGPLQILPLEQAPRSGLECRACTSHCISAIEHAVATLLSTHFGDFQPLPNRLVPLCRRVVSCHPTRDEPGTGFLVAPQRDRGGCGGGLGRGSGTTQKGGSGLGGWDLRWREGAGARKEDRQNAHAFVVPLWSLGAGGESGVGRGGRGLGSEALPLRGGMCGEARTGAHGGEE